MSYTLLKNKEFLKEISSTLLLNLSVSFISTFLSIILALFSLYHLLKTPSFLRKFLISLWSIPSGISTVVSTLSLLSFFGKQGIFTYLTLCLGMPWDSSYLYSYSMIIFLNILYNFPMLTLVFYTIHKNFPYEYIKKAQSLGASKIQSYLSVLLPLWKPHLSSAFALVFSYCFINFFPVLFLGSPLNYKTLEVIIYEKITLTFSFDQSCLIAIIQSFFLFAILSVFLTITPQYANKSHSLNERSYISKKSLVLTLILGIISSLVWLPLLLKATLFSPTQLINELIKSLPAFTNSFIIAFSSSFITIFLAIFSLFNFPKLFERKSFLFLLFLPFTFSPLLSSYVYQEAINTFSNNSVFLCIITSQSLTSFPFICFLLTRDLFYFETLPLKSHALGVKGLKRWVSLDFPFFKRSYFRAFLLCFVSSLGNISTGFLYLPRSFETIPIRINRLLKFYRINEALILASFLAIILLGLITLTQQIGRNK